MTNKTPPTHIQFLDIPEANRPPGPRLHKLRRVLINGTEVDVQPGGIDMTYGNNEVTTVTLTLMPTTVTFGHDTPDE